MATGSLAGNVCLSASSRSSSICANVASDALCEIILEWSSGLVYRWYCLGEKEGTLNAEDEKMMEGIDRTTAAYLLAAMKIQWSKQPKDFCEAMRCGQTGVCD
jgi:hypothetical protein